MPPLAAGSVPSACDLVLPRPSWAVVTDVTPLRGARESASPEGVASRVPTTPSSNRSVNGEPWVGEAFCEACLEAAVSAADADRRAAGVVVDASLAGRLRSTRNRTIKPLSGLISPLRLRQGTEQQESV